MGLLIWRFSGAEEIQSKTLKDFKNLSDLAYLFSKLLFVAHFETNKWFNRYIFVLKN